MQALEASLSNQKLQVEYVTAKGQQVETEVRQFLPEFMPDELRLSTANLNQQWSVFEQVRKACIIICIARPIVSLEVTMNFDSFIPVTPG